MSSIQQGRPEAAAAIWAWRQAGGDAGSESGGAGRARLRGVLQAFAGGAIGAALYLLWSQTVGTVVLGIASLIAVAALVSPTGLFALVERLFAALGHATGRALTWALMTPLFYLFFLPFGLLLRRGRRDRLKRYYDREAGSYWEPHEGVTASSASMTKQY